MKKLGQKGFTLVEGLLVVIAIALIVGVGYYVYNSTKKTDPSKATSAAVVPQKKYLEIPELGIKFELTDKLKNAYYGKSDGIYYVSVHDIDNTAGLEGCKATGSGGGFYVLKSGEIGGDNGTPGGGVWTKEDLDKNGWAKVGNTYYGFMHGSVPCYDQNASNASQLASTASDFMQAFIAQQSTIQKL